MKIKFTLFAFAFAILSVILSSYSSGADANIQHDGTGATSSSTGCNTGGGCHNATTSIAPTVELDSAGIAVTSYHPGGTYNIKITATNSTTHTLPKFGFQLATVDSAGAGTTSAIQAGTWVSNSLPLHVQETPSNGSVPVPIIEQTTQIVATTGTGGTGTTYVESVQWVAPAAGTGSIKICGVVNAVVGNDQQSQDYYQTATPVTIKEATAPNGINTLTNEINGLKVYPSLMNDRVTIVFDMKEQASVTASLISINGQEAKALMTNESIGTGAFKNTFDVNGLTAGVYLLKVQIENSFIVSKVVKE